MAALDPVETLQRVPFFAVLRGEELKALARHCVVRHITKDELLFAEGDPCEGLFVVQEGAIKLFKMADTGREQVLMIERAGSTVAELPIFDGGNFPTSASAVENSTLLFLPKRVFLDLCRRNCSMGLASLERPSVCYDRCAAEVCPAAPQRTAHSPCGGDYSCIQ